MIVDDAKLNSDILSNYKLDVNVNDGKCEADVVKKRLTDLIRIKDTSKLCSTVGNAWQEIPTHESKSSNFIFSQVQLD